MGRQGGANNMLWFLAGLSVGTAAALVFAPKSGAQTREFLGEKANAARGFLAASGREYVDLGRDLYQQGRTLADEAAEIFAEGQRLVESAGGE